jgi:hypothetical protein
VAYRLALASAVLAAGVGLAAAPTAAADPGVNYADYVYFSYLKDHGLRLDNPKQLKDIGLSICHALDDGLPWQRVGNNVMGYGATQQQAMVEIQGAVTAYCPRNQHRLTP